MAEALEEQVPEALAGERVDRVVAMLTGLPRAEVAQLVTAGAVRLRGREVATRATRVGAGDWLEIALADPVAAPEVDPVDIAAVDALLVHADPDVLVVDKPPGLVVHPGAGNPTGTLSQALAARFPELADVGDPDRPGIVHRLDAGTSGLLVVARSAAAYDALVAALAARVVERRYLALVKGWPEPARAQVDAPIGRSRRDPTKMATTPRGREARTDFETDRRYEEPVPTALLGCRLETGRTHQVRVHLSAIGHPVVGDARYGGSLEAVPLGRPFLHATRLAFDHPVTGQRLAFDSPLPADLAEVLASLR